MPGMREPRLAHSVDIGGRNIAFSVRRSNRRTVGLSITDQGLSIALPARFPLSDLHPILQQKARWILAKLDAQQQKPTSPSIAFGESVDWLGRPYRLTHGARTLAPRAGVICLDATSHESAEVQLAKLMWREASEYLQERLWHWADRMELKPSGFALSNARRQWGICTSRGMIRLNWRLMQAPPAVIDYVVIHELCHLIELNHSSRFWALVERACPLWREHRLWLKTHGDRYFFV